MREYCSFTTTGTRRNTDGMELFIREAARDKGLGGRFLAAIEVEGKRRGCTRLLLFNRKERESYQRGFYPNHGWEERDDAALFNRWLTEDL
jgi:GNAT superfamily N-acetyltransferase